MPELVGPQPDSAHFHWLVEWRSGGLVCPLVARVASSGPWWPCVALVASTSPEHTALRGSMLTQIGESQVTAI